MTFEIWKPIQGYEGLYEISDQGRLKSVDRFVNGPYGRSQLCRGAILKPYTNKDGYLVATLSKNSVLFHIGIHRLVANHFLPYSRLPEVNHIDLVRSNNTSSNLEWTDRVGNMEHSRKLGMYAGRTNQNMAKKLNPQIADAILRARSTGRTYADIAREYDIATSTAHRICIGRLWAIRPECALAAAPIVQKVVA